MLQFYATLCTMFCCTTQGKKIFIVVIVLLTINVVDVQKFSLISKINATLFTFPVPLFFVSVRNLLPVRWIGIYWGCNVSMRRIFRYLRIISFKKRSQVEIIPDYILFSLSVATVSVAVDVSGTTGLSRRLLAIVRPCK